MPASQRELFVGLLRELRATGPLGRLRLLGRGVAALRQLSPWDRKVLLRMAGFEGAESLIERLATEDGETAERLHRVLAEIERDPKRAEATVRALSDPQQRGEAIESLVDLLDRANQEDAPPPAPPAPPAPAAPPMPSPPLPSLPEDAPLPELAGGSVRPAPPASARVAAAATVAAAAAAKAEAEKAKPVEPDPAPPPAPERPLPRPPAPPEPTRPREPPPPEATARPTSPELSDPSSDLAERSAQGVLHTLLDLRRRLEAGESVPGEALRTFLADESHPAWARRRAVTAWIEARRPDADEALGVIGELGSAGDRAWCLGALAASRSWSQAAWEKILDAAPDDSTRRRLARRRAA